MGKDNIIGGVNSMGNIEILSHLTGIPKVKLDAKAESIIDIYKKQDMLELTEKEILNLEILKEYDKRLMEEKISYKIKCSSPKDFYNNFGKDLQKEDQEIFRVILINDNNFVIHVKDLFKGTAHNALLSPELIIKEALKAKGYRILLMHNHPLGDAKPNTDDNNFTKHMIKTMKLFVDLKILDHIIIGNDGFYSYREMQPRLFT